MIETVDFRRSVPPVAPHLHERLSACLEHLVGSQDLGTLMRESRAHGSDRERGAGVRFLSCRLGADISPDRVLITNGTQSALILLLRDLVGSDGVLLTEELTYGALRSLARKCAVRVEGIAIDSEGIRPDAFEEACRRHSPRALYCNPTLHNPTTAIMSLVRRWQLIEVARKHGVTIIEDEALGRLYSEAPQPIATLAPDICWYLMSATKSLSHGLRLSYAVAPSEQAALQMLESWDALSFWVPTPLTTAIMTCWVESGVADLISGGIAQECLLRQQAATQILADFQVRAPQGAMHIWVALAQGNADEFTQFAQKNGVLLRPASHFSVSETPAPNYLRLSLSTPPSLAEVGHGLRALRQMLEKECGRI